MTIRYLAQEGEQIATLARRFGLSRQTIYNQLARATAAPAPRPRHPSALDAFRDYVGARLASFDLPAPGAAPRAPGTRLHRRPHDPPRRHAAAQGRADPPRYRAVRDLAGSPGSSGLGRMRHDHARRGDDQALLLRFRAGLQPYVLRALHDEHEAARAACRPPSTRSASRPSSLSIT